MNPFSCEVCGEPGDMPCVLSSCDGPSCRGPLPLSSDAVQQAQEAEFVIHNLSNQVQGWKLRVNMSSLVLFVKNQEDEVTAVRSHSCQK